MLLPKQLLDGKNAQNRKIKFFDFFYFGKLFFSRTVLQALENKSAFWNFENRMSQLSYAFSIAEEN